jgi:hypothetical protein
MRFIYRDAETAEEVVPTYSVMELNKEHRIRYVLNTSQGAIILRPLPWRMKRIIDDARANIYPRTKELLEEAERLRPYIDGIPQDQWIPEKVERLKAIYLELRVTDMYALGVILSPQVGTMEDVMEMYSMLTEDEGEKLALCIQALSTITPAEDIDGTALEIAKANGLELLTKEMLDLMTVSQANYYMRRIEQENERIRQLTSQYTQEKVVR